MEEVSENKKKMDSTLKWQLWLGIIFTVIGIVNVILLVVLENAGIFEPRDNWWLFGLGFFPCVWLPLLTQWLFKTKWSFVLVLVFDIYVLCAITLGSMWNLFAMGWGFDKIVHVVGGAMWSLIPYDVFRNSNQEKNKLSTPWLALLLIGFSMMCGSVWEIYEYSTDALFGFNSQYTAGLTGHAALGYTMGDIICDFVGAVVATVGILIYLHIKKKKTQEKDSQTETTQQITE